MPVAGVIMLEPGDAAITVLLIPFQETLVAGVGLQMEALTTVLPGPFEGPFEEAVADALALVIRVNGDGVDAAGARMEAQEEGGLQEALLPNHPDFLVMAAQAVVKGFPGIPALRFKADGFEFHEIRQIGRARPVNVHFRNIKRDLRTIINLN